MFDDWQPGLGIARWTQDISLWALQSSTKGKPHVWSSSCLQLTGICVYMVHRIYTYIHTLCQISLFSGTLWGINTGKLFISFGFACTAPLTNITVIHSVTSSIQRYFLHW